MKTMLTFAILTIASGFTLFSQQREEVVSNDDLFAPFRTVYRNVESMDFSTPNGKRSGSALKHHVYQKHDMMNGVYYSGQLEQYGKNTHGVTIRSNDYTTVRRGSSRTGGSTHDRNRSSKKRQNDRHAQFMANKRAAMAEAKLREEERRRREKEEDDRRASIATQKANEGMQVVTDARIANDRYNAGQGLQNARVASKSRAYSQMRGYVRPRQAANGRGSRAVDALTKTHDNRVNYSPRMKSALHPKLLQNPMTLRKPKLYVYRKVAQNNKYEFTGRMTKTSIYIEKDPRFGVSDRYDAPKPIASNQGFRLSPDAVVTTGQLINNDELRARYIPERPKNAPQRRHVYDWDEMMKEFFPENYK